MDTKNLNKINRLLSESFGDMDEDLKLGDESKEEISTTVAAASLEEGDEESAEAKAEKEEAEGKDMEAAEKENEPKKEELEEKRLREAVEETNRVDIDHDPEHKKMLEAISRLNISEMVTKAADDLRQGKKYSIEEAKQDAGIVARGLAEWASKFQECINEHFKMNEEDEKKDEKEEKKEKKEKLDEKKK